jgi:hypothetical protein
MPSFYTSHSAKEQTAVINYILLATTGWAFFQTHYTKHILEHEIQLNGTNQSFVFTKNTEAIHASFAIERMSSYLYEYSYPQF